MPSDNLKQQRLFERKKDSYEERGETDQLEVCSANAFRSFFIIYIPGRRRKESLKIKHIVNLCKASGLLNCSRDTHISVTINREKERKNEQNIG